MKKLLYLLFFMSVALTSHAQFTDIGQSFQGVSEGIPCWGDYDGDGDLDLHVSGYNSGTNYWKVYKNKSGTFSALSANIFPARYSYSSWCDWDNDGDLDGISTGWGSAIRTYTWRNNGDDTFSNTQTLSNINSGSMAWADYDNDGDEDLLLNGWNGSAVTSIVYKNVNGTFTNINAGLQGVQYSSSAWCDWDNDGDYDILYSGHTGSANFIGSYRNDNGTFTYVDLGITAVRIGSLSWADYDADGDADLLITGYNGTSGFSDIYINDKGTFTAASAGLPGLYWSSGEWADYDNDGDYDILLSGTTNGTTKFTAIYSNSSGVFTQTADVLPGIWKGAAKWGDYDNDGDLDIVVMGESTSGNITRIYRNDYITQNKPPDRPSNLTLSEDNGRLLFSFEAGYDDPDPIVSLTYNIRINNLNSDSLIMMPHSNGDGILSVPAVGNIGYKLDWTYNRTYLPQETVTADWEAQTVDIGYSGSIFEGYTDTFQLHDLDITSDSQLLHSDSLFISSAYTDSISDYTLQIDDDIAFGSPFSDTINPSKKSGKDSYLTVSLDQLSFCNSLLDGTTYYWRIKPNYSNLSRVTYYSQSAKSFLFLNEFSASSQILSGLDGDTAWGDYDNDGDLDVIITGTDDSYTAYTRLFRNDAGTFTEITHSIVPAQNSAVAWGDYDNDNDLDLLITCPNGSKIYRNDSGSFIDISAGLSTVFSGSAEWCDYDNDGDLDIFICGYNSSVRLSKIYRNDSGSFTDISASLTGVWLSSADWGDFDNDGDADLLFIGDTGSGVVSRLYSNNSGSFTELPASSDVGSQGSVKWGDYDNDGDLDILYCARPGLNSFSKIFRNEPDHSFTAISAGLTGLWESSAAWGDYDNDGDLDIILTGADDTLERHTLVYRNDLGSFTEISAEIEGGMKGSVNWIDYDNDGDLDIALNGRNSSDSVFFKIYDNNCSVSNNVPSQPVNLNTTVSGQDIVFSFDGSADNETLSTGLSYNISVDVDDAAVKSSMSDQSTGYRKITGYGNIGQNRSWTLKNNMNNILPQEEFSITFKAQSVDNCFAGSSFATLNENLSGEQLELVNGPELYTNDSLFWSSAYSDSVTNYTIQVDQDPNFTVPYEETLDKTKSPKAAYITKAIDELSFYSSLTKDVTYFWRIRPNYSNPSRTSVFSEVPGSFKLIPEFSEIGATLKGLAFGSSFWGDYDNDGDLDILVTGQDETSHSYTLIYRNDGSDTFTDINAGLDGVNYSYADWGDYDNDGDLDIVLMGAHPESELFIYRNDSGSFTSISTGISCFGYGTVKWGDKDNDGDLDLLVTGQDGSSNEMSKIFENNNGIFSESNVGELFPLEWSCGDWLDYDNDGDLDIIISGRRDIFFFKTILYTNVGGSFIYYDEYVGVSRSSIAIADYNNDGFIDAAVCGYNDPENETLILTNYSGSLAYDMDLPGFQDGSLDFGDCDNDGDPDLLISGNTGSEMITKIFLNNSGTFVDSGIDLHGSNRGRASWGDYDNDGDLDILVNGRDGANNYFTSVYKNNSQTSNTAPVSPSNLTAAAYSDHVSISFDPGTDNETPVAGLNYNVNIEINDEYVKPAMADLSTGKLRMPLKGNLNKVTEYDLMREIYPQESLQTILKVQTVDAGYAGSAFASQSTTLYGPDLELLCEPVMYMNDSLLWSSDYSDSILNYTIQVSELSDFSYGVLEQTVDKSKNPKAAYITKALDEFSFAGNLRKGVANYWRIRPNYSDFRASRFSGNISSFSIYPMFSRIDAGLNGYEESTLSWGDLDNDGDLDMAIHSQDSLRIMMNNGGNFTWSFSTQIYMPYKSDVKYLNCSDFNNDGFCDVAAATNDEIKLLINNSGTFSEDNIVTYYIHTVGPIEMCDIDNDGDNDLVYCDYEYLYLRFYENGLFSDPSTINTSSSNDIFKMIDYDNDGDMDILINGYNNSTWEPEFDIYINENSIFTKAGFNISGFDLCVFDLGDYDNDGDMDILISGDEFMSGNVTKIIRNDISGLTDTGTTYTGIRFGDVKWFDSDCDGDLDILISGITNHPIFETKMYINDNGVFSEISPHLSNYKYTTIKPADFDNDGDVDLFISGQSDSVHTYTALYRNNSQNSNTSPLPPSGLNLTHSENGMTVSFSPGSDNETPSAGLSYNIELGVNEFTGKSSMSDISTGYRKIVGQGNIGQVNSWIFNRTDLPEAIIPQEIVNLWCKVQSIDHCFAGSSFAEGNTQTTNRDLQFLPKQYMSGTDELVWEFVMSDSVASYTIQMATDTNFEPCYEQTLYTTKDGKTGYVGVALEDLDFFGSLTDDTEYFWRVKPDHVNPSKMTAYNSEPNSFIFNPSLVPPQNITITVDGQYITLDWSGVKTTKAEPDFYTVYSSNDPYAAFPSGWTQETSTSNTSFILVSPLTKKFYCVTANNFAKKLKIDRSAVTR